MSKHEKIPTPGREPSPDLVRRVEEYYRAYRAENQGQNPTRAELNAVVKTSLTPLCKAARLVEDRLDAIETKLGAMPSIPEDLRLMQDQFLRDLWSRTQDLGNTELMAYRRASELQDDKHRREVAQTLDILEAVEAERDVALKERDVATSEVVTLRTALSAREAALVVADARIKELHSILALLGRESTTAPAAMTGEEIVASGDGAVSSAPHADTVETLDLPGMTFLEPEGRSSSN